MSPETVGVLGVLLFLVAMAAGMRIAYAALLAGLVGFALIRGWGTAMASVGFIPWNQVALFSFGVIPMYILMGFITEHTGLADEIFNAAARWFGHLPGGLAVAATFGAAGFGATTGSSASAVAVGGKILTPRMRAVGYHDSLAVGTVAGTGTLALLIPPSIVMVLYGLITDQSIGAVLLGGVIPGVLSAVVISAMIVGICILRPKLARPIPPASWRERFISLKGLSTVLIVILITLGGLYAGVFTPTESGAVGAFGIFAIALARRRLTWKRLRSILNDTLDITVMVLTITIGIFTFMNFLSLSRVASSVLNLIVESSLSPWAFLILVFAAYLVLGSFVGSFGMMILSVPLILPAVIQLGFNPIWFGIITVKFCEIAELTPPVGINLYVAHSVTGVSIPRISSYVLPFIGADIVIVGILIAFPQIVTFLPNLMGMS